MIARIILATFFGAAALFEAAWLSGGDPLTIVKPWPALFIMAAPILVILFGRGQIRMRIAFAGKALAAGALLCFVAVVVDMMRNLADPSAVMATLVAGMVPGLYALLAESLVLGPARADARYLDSLGLHGGSEGPKRSSREGLKALARSALLFGIAFAIAAAMAGWFLWHFIDWASFVVALALPLGALIAWPGPTGMARALGAIMGSRPSGIEDALLAQEAFGYLARSFLLSGGIGFSLGAIYFLREIDDKARMGPSLALALCSLLLCLLGYLFIALPLEAAAKARVASFEGSEDE